MPATTNQATTMKAIAPNINGSPGALMFRDIDAPEHPHLRQPPDRTHTPAPAREDTRRSRPAGPHSPAPGPAGRTCQLFTEKRAAGPWFKPAGLFGPGRRASPANQSDVSSKPQKRM